jgi:Domain of unknown function (DUF5134)
MVHSAILSWILTIVFGLSGAWALFGCARPSADSTVADLADRISCAAHALMGAAMIAMVWGWQTKAPGRLQVVVFGAAAIWFLALTVRPAFPSALPTAMTLRLSNLHHALMMAAAVWMIVTTPASMPMGTGRSMPPSAASTPTAAVVFGAALVAYFLFAALPWAIGAVDLAQRAMNRGGRGRTSPHQVVTGTRVPGRHSLDAAGHAAMSVGMGVLLLTVL